MNKIELTYFTRGWPYAILAAYDGERAAPWKTASDNGLSDPHRWRGEGLSTFPVDDSVHI